MIQTISNKALWHSPVIEQTEGEGITRTLYTVHESMFGDWLRSERVQYGAQSFEGIWDLPNWLVMA